MREGSKSRLGSKREEKAVRGEGLKGEVSGGEGGIGEVSGGEGGFGEVSVGEREELEKVSDEK